MSIDKTSESEMPVSLKAGQSVGQQMVPMLQFFLDNTDDRVHFWAGFIGVIVGSAVADIGGEATSILGGAFSGIAEDIAKKKAH